MANVRKLKEDEIAEVLVLYFRAKAMLSNPRARDILNGAVASPDQRLISVYSNFVNFIEAVNVASGQANYKHWVDFLRDLEGTYELQMQNGTFNGSAVSQDQQATFRMLRIDPFNERLKPYIKRYLQDGTKTTIMNAVNGNDRALSTIRGVNLAVGATTHDTYQNAALKALYRGISLQQANERISTLESQNATLSYENAMLENEAARSRLSERKLKKSNLGHKIATGVTAIGLAAAIALGGATVAKNMDKIDNLESENSAYSVQIQEKEAQIQKMNEDYNKLLSMYNELLAGSSKDSQKYIDFIKNVDALLSEMHYALLLGEGETGHRLSPEEMESINAKIAELQKMEEIVGEYASSIGISIGGIAVNIERIQAEIGTLMVKVDALEKQTAELVKQGKADAATIAALQSSKTALEAQVKELQEQIKNAGSSSSAQVKELQAQIAELQAKLKNTEDNLAKVTVERDNAYATIAELNAQISQLQSNVQTLEGKLVAAIEQGKTDAATIAALQNTIKTLEGQVADLQAKLAALEGSSSAEVVKLQAQIAELQERLAEAQEAIKQVTAERDEALQENASLKTNIAALESKVAELQTKLNNAVSKEEAAAIREELDKAKAELVEAKAERDQLLGEIEKYTSEIAQLKLDNAAAANKLAEAIQMYNDLKSAADAKDAEAQAIIEQLRATIEAQVLGGQANSSFIRSLYKTIMLSDPAPGMTDNQIRAAIANELGLNYSENTQGSESNERAQ